MRPGLSVATVRNHLKVIYVRFGVRGIGPACYHFCLEVRRDEDATPALRSDEV